MGERMHSHPTPRKEWVKAGDECESPTGARGKVLRVLAFLSGPLAQVQWENGHVGRVTITQLRKREEL